MIYSKVCVKFQLSSFTRSYLTRKLMMPIKLVSIWYCKWHFYLALSCFGTIGSTCIIIVFLLGATCRKWWTRKYVLFIQGFCQGEESKCPHEKSQTTWSWEQPVYCRLHCCNSYIHLLCQCMTLTLFDFPLCYLVTLQHL